MSRRKRERKKQNGGKTPDQEPVADQPWSFPTAGWLLAGAILLQAAWTAFLIVMAAAG